MTTLSGNSARGLVPLLALTLLAFAFGPAGAANIVIINNDGAGEGFNDPTPVAPVGGNPGVTVGQQRLNVFNHAASIWGSLLSSSVTTEVRAQFNPQTCNATGAVLGSAGPVLVWRDFASAPAGGHWYHSALANALEGVDLDAGAQPEISATFNSNLGPGGSPACPFDWYLGLDGNEGTAVELLPVVLHEIGHGLGFSTTTSGATGAFFSGFPSIFDRYLRDNTSGLLWDQMTDAQRMASAVNTGNLVWNGAKTSTAATAYLDNRPELVINAPGGIAGSYAAVGANFGAALTQAGVTGDIELVDDGAGTTSDGCEPLIGFTPGNIALIDRGTCAFVIKAQNAQAAGASAVIIANNASGLPPTLGGTDPTISIPVIGISQADGNLIKANLPGVNGNVGLHPTLLAGADASGRVLMYAPNPYQGGSSVSHFDVTLTPNALMEPAINGSLHDNVDLTLDLFCDIGWTPLATPVLLAQFVAAGRQDGIFVTWQFGDLGDAVLVALQRSTTEDGPWMLVATNVGSETSGSTLDAAVEPGVLYYYRLQVIDREGTSRNIGLTSGRRLDAFAGDLDLSPPWPNPARNGATVSFSIGGPEYVRLSIVDASGRKIRTLHEGMLPPGRHSLQWDGLTDRGNGVGAGLYFVSLRTSEGVKTQRMAVVH